MKKISICIIIALTTLQSCAQVDRKPIDNPLTLNNNAVTYRLFPTQNMWTFIKLNTRNGQMWQVQYDVKENNRFETSLNSESLTPNDKELNDRFTLYSTQNIYTFLLLDQIDGRTWQVQWSIDAKKRFILPIQKEPTY